LVHDEKHALVSLSPPLEKGQRDTELIQAEKLPGGFRVVTELRNQSLTQGDKGLVARMTHHDAPALGARRRESGSQERGFSGTGRSDEGKKVKTAQLLPDRLHLFLPAASSSEKGERPG
jgi:hypothetical protein